MQSNAKQGKAMQSKATHNKATRIMPLNNAAGVGETVGATVTGHISITKTILINEATAHGTSGWNHMDLMYHP